MNFFVKQALTHGKTKVSDGLWLHTRQHLELQQKSWPADAPGKDKDFSSSPFWLRTNDGKTAGMEEDALL